MKLALPVFLALSLLIAATAAEKQTREKPIAAAVGKEFKIELESNPTTGYQWLLAKPLDKALLKQLNRSYKRPKSNLAGAPGKEELVFMPLAEGKTEIRLKYAPLWEKETPAERATNFVVVISKPL